MYAKYCKSDFFIFSPFKFQSNKIYTRIISFVIYVSNIFCEIMWY
jgi:hypothetical protein